VRQHDHAGLLDGQNFHFVAAPLGADRREIGGGNPGLGSPPPAPPPKLLPPGPGWELVDGNVLFNVWIREVRNANTNRNADRGLAPLENTITVPGEA
jgi:hypothetical protein